MSRIVRLFGSIMKNQERLVERTLPPHHNPKVATTIGIIAIAFWSSLALLTKLSGPLPPFELLSISFAVAFASSVLIIFWRGGAAFNVWRQPLAAWSFSFAGIFTYHALYFFALSRVPAAEASLIAYLWPLLIVLFSALTDRRTLRFHHLAGATIGFLGSAIIVLDASRPSIIAFDALGYLAAGGCAVVWSAYSVMNRRFDKIPSEMIGGVCGLVAVTGLIVHVFTEQTIWPTSGQWIAIILLGIGPVGAAFFAWDYATKHGHVPLLGALSYLAPLFSTLLLLSAGLSPVNWSVIAATLLIVTGAIVATLRIGWDRGRGFRMNGVPK